ncbi:MAG: HAD hydrolase-like protein [Alphaproteobacteria bacterium]|nr:HAD hydrolase-like protein [Alphaproteobacteria bacterium]
MNQKIKYISRIKDEFDTVICGVNGVFLSGNEIMTSGLDALIKLYQSGKNVCLASNTSLRVADLYYLLKKYDVPMNIFHAMITAGEIAHFYLKNSSSVGHTYFCLSGLDSCVTKGLPYTAVNNLVMADFVLVETNDVGFVAEQYYPQLEQALQLGLPLLCVGNDVSVICHGERRINAGAVAEQYAMMGGKIISFGKPDVRLAAYLTEDMPRFSASRCLVIGDCMSTDMHMGNHFGAKTLFLTNGVHQLENAADVHLNELADHYGLSVDYYMENLQW